MDGGDGADTLHNETTGVLIAKADARASSTSVALTFEGASAAYAGTEAIADAWAMFGGAGQDSITNTGNITAISLADATSTGVSGNIFGLAAAFAGAVADAKPTGMAGGEDADTLISTGRIDIKAKSHVDASSLSFNLAGVASSRVAESRADVLAIGIDGGAGDDTLTNTGLITIGLADDAAPMAKAYARSASWNLAGAALSDAVLSATARAMGIAGGEGNDSILNTGTITVGPRLVGPAMVYGDLSGASWTFAGGAATDATATVTSESTGLSGGAGTDSIRNEGTVTVNAYSDLLAENGAKATFIGGNSSSATTTANATGTGLDGGAGDSTLVNEGTLNVVSHARNRASNTSETGFLFGNGDATSTANATVNGYGMKAAAGISRIDNVLDHLIEVSVATLADSYSYSDGADLTVVTGDASSTATATSSADVVGILAADGQNTITNDGIVTATARKAASDTAMAYAYAEADGNGADGDGWGQATATAMATVAGIRAGSGTNVITNTGSVIVTAEPTSYAKVTIDGENNGDATGNTYSTATAVAVGIDTGDGDSTVINSGALTVSARPVADVSRSVDEGWLGSSYGGNSAEASATAVGIRSGDGNSMIANTGSITVSAEATSNYSRASLSSTAAGIQTGNGNDTVVTSGTIHVTRAGGDGMALAIATGAGNDYVSLLAGSDTAQDIELGQGQDTLLLAAGAAFTGVAHADPAAAAGPDIDTFVLGGDAAAGVFDHAVIGAAARYRGFDAFRKQGHSTWTLTGDRTIDWTVDEGTLAIASQLTGTIQTAAASSGAVIDVLADGEIRAGLGGPVVLDGTGTLVNRGVIEGTLVNGNPVSVLVRGHDNYVFNSGQITVHGPDTSPSVGIVLQGNDGLVLNTGVVRSDGPAGSAIVLAGDANQVLNRGLLTSAGPAVSFESAAGTGNTLQNLVGGVIESTGTLAIVGGAGDDHLTNDSDIRGAVALGDGNNGLLNHGNIRGSVTTGAGEDALTNDGEIQGAVDLGDGNNGLLNHGNIRGGVTTGAGDDHLANDSDIRGAVALGDGTDELANHGNIVGGVTSGTGDDAVTNDGDILGAVDLGDGNDELANHGNILGGVTTGAGDDRIENNGEVRGTAGVALDLGDGADRLMIAASSLIDGTADGGAGTDTFVLGGNSDGAFNLDAIDSTYIRFEKFRKEDASRWVLTGSGSGSATGPWTLADGALIVNGSLLGDVLVESPGRLGGIGSVGSLVNHGTVAPGNSIGVLDVARDYVHGRMPCSRLRSTAPATATVWTWVARPPCRAARFRSCRRDRSESRPSTASSRPTVASTAALPRCTRHWTFLTPSSTTDRTGSYSR